MTTPVESAVVRREADVAAVTWDDARGRLSFRSLIDGDATPTSQLTFGTAVVEVNGFLALHRHPQAEIYYILAGTADVTINGVLHTAEAGTGIFIPSNAEHGIVNVSSQSVKFLYGFAADRFSDIPYTFT